MAITRRDLLAGTAAGTAAAALPACRDKTDSLDTGPGHSPTREAEPSPYLPAGTEDLAAFPVGVQTGDAGPESVQVCVRSTEERVTLGLWRGDGSDWVEHPLADVVELAGSVGRVELSGLEPDSVYSLVAWSEDGTRRSPVSRFRTALADGQDRQLVFGASSCLGYPNRPWPTLSVAAEERLDFFLLLGDTVYADGAVTDADYRAEWDDVLGVQGLFELAASTSLVATWDDHELDNDWSWEVVGQEQYDAALGAFRDALPQIEGPSGGIWRQLPWGDTLELFVLDCRSEREGGVQLVSEEQLSWLLSALSASTARFKVVLTDMQMTDLEDIFVNLQAEYRWQGYADQRERVLGHIEDEGIQGVFFVTGDLHYGAWNMVGRAGEPGAGHSELMVGPAGSNLNVAAEFFEPNDQYLALLGAWSFTRFTADATAGTVRFEFVGDDGTVLMSDVLAL